MLFFLDWMPSSAGLFGALHISDRQDIDDEADQVVLVHRRVALPFNAHIRGPKCPCSPMRRTKGEVDSSAFKYECSTNIGGYH